jgi:hypothetical protein
LVFCWRRLRWVFGDFCWHPRDGDFCWHPRDGVGLPGLPLCGAALTFFAAAKKVSKESG